MGDSVNYWINEECICTTELVSKPIVQELIAYSAIYFDNGN